jgi:acyl carrier protein
MNDIVEQAFLKIVADAMFRGNIESVMKIKKENCFLHAIGADSLDTLQIMIALRETFDINITEEKAENFVKMSYSEILYMLESAGASAESMQRKLARKQVKPVIDKSSSS